MGTQHAHGPFQSVFLLNRAPKLLYATVRRIEEVPYFMQVCSKIVVFLEKQFSSVSTNVHLRKVHFEKQWFQLLSLRIDLSIPMFYQTDHCDQKQKPCVYQNYQYKNIYHYHNNLKLRHLFNILSIEAWSIAMYDLAANQRFWVTRGSIKRLILIIDATQQQTDSCEDRHISDLIPDRIVYKKLL